MKPVSARKAASLGAAIAVVLAFSGMSPVLAQSPGSSPASRLPSLADLLDASVRAGLKAEGKAVRAVSGLEASKPELTPRAAAGAELRAAIAADAPSILVEAVFLLERPAPADAVAEFTRAYGILRSISSLQGILYWSASRKTWRTFYEESWRIDGPESKLRMADGIPAGIPPADATVFAHQKDLSFGENVYRYRYRTFGLPGTATGPGAAAAGPLAISVESTNLTRMSYSFVPAMGPEGLKTRLLVLPCVEGILFYASSAAKAPAIPGLRGKLEDSFSNRAAALFTWFGERYRAP
jgi:hypothetical protein